MRPRRNSAQTNYCTQPVMVLEGQLPLRCLHSWNIWKNLDWLFVRECEKRKGARMQKSWNHRWLKRSISKTTLAGANNTKWELRSFFRWIVASGKSPGFGTQTRSCVSSTSTFAKQYACDPMPYTCSIQLTIFPSFCLSQKMFAAGDSLPTNVKGDLRLPVFIPPSRS